MRKIIYGAVFFTAASLLLSYSPAELNTFLEKPYLQLGDAPMLASVESLVLLWHTDNEPADWRVEVRTSKDKAWRAVGNPSSQLVSAPAGAAWITVNKAGVKRENPAPEAIALHLVYRARLTSLVPGEEFHYRLLKGGKPVFDATGRARKSAGQPFRFALFGDCGEGTLAENAIAYQTSLAKPDFIFIPGDIVYGSGRISEYRQRFFPNYSAEEPSAKNGAPLLQSIPFIAAPGNHDTALNNFLRYPDSLAYFFVSFRQGCSQPGAKMKFRICAQRNGRPERITTGGVRDALYHPGQFDPGCGVRPIGIRGGFRQGHDRES